MQSSQKTPLLPTHAPAPAAEAAKEEDGHPAASVARFSDQQAAEDRAIVQATDVRTGLSDAMVIERREKYGWNMLEEKKRSLLMIFLSFLWGPMPAMIWAAALVEFIKGVLGDAQAWPDFIVLLILQFANAIVG